MNKSINYSNRKYLIISHNYWPAIGGAEKLLQSIAENLHKNDIYVDVLTSNAKNAAMYFSKKPEIVGSLKEKINGVWVTRVDIRNIFQFISKVIWSLFRNKKVLINIEPILIGPHFVMYVLKYIFSKKIYTHIICGPFPTSIPFYGYIIKLISPKIKLIIDPSLHVDDPMHTGKLLRFISKKADAILVRTEEETRLLRRWGIDHSKIFEIGVGVDDELIESNDLPQGNILPFDYYILYMGQEVPHKNILTLINAMSNLWSVGVTANLVIAGARTEYSKVIDEEIKKLEFDYQKRIFRINNFNEKNKKSLLDNCQFLVLPSSRESFGIVFVEAWSRKKTVIGTNVAGIRFLIEDKKDGLLFNENDIIDLQEKILFLIKNKDLAIRMGQVGFSKVNEKYRWQSIINKILSIDSKLA